MELEIHHKTSYTYDQPVFLENHYLNFKPLARKHITLLNFDLQVHPVPNNIFELLDAENNTFHQLWPQDISTTTLDIEATIKLKTRPFNPFDFIVDPQVSPSERTFFYSSGREAFLNPYLATQEYPCIKSFVEETIDQNDDTMVTFLALLIQKVYDGWDHVKRDEEDAPNARQCFLDKKGSCKDLAWMVMVMLRGTGLAARFVSGYAYNPQLDYGHELHAWVEVLLPGAGWIGLDPSAGLFVNEFYVPVATSYDPSLTMPVDGSYRGNATSHLEAFVEIEVMDD